MQIDGIELMSELLQNETWSHIPIIGESPLPAGMDKYCSATLNTVVIPDYSLGLALANHLYTNHSVRPVMLVLQGGSVSSAACSLSECGLHMLQ